MTQTHIKKADPQQQPEASNPADLDRVSLTQALRDFEIANARVLDLTQRLVESERRRRELEHELEQLRHSGPAPTLPYRAARWAFHRARDAAKRVLSQR
jgi:hypothetical protein